MTPPSAAPSQTISSSSSAGTSRRQMLNKVPEVTAYFWIIKVLCTTVGETAADYLNVNLNFGLTGTSIITGLLLAVVLFFQFRSSRYLPSIYWLTVALVSVFGTLVTDNLTDKAGVPLRISTMIFGALLALTFITWYLTEKSLSIHSIFTTRREAFYWLTILFAFALGTATGDLMAEDLGLGYLVTGAIVAGLIALTAVAWRLGLNSVLSFWIIYILTRPLGASIGDYLSQPTHQGGLGLGVTVTSVIFIGGILAIVTYLSLTGADAIATPPTGHDGEAIDSRVPETAERGGLWQTIVVVAVLLIAGVTGYNLRRSSLESDVSNTDTAADVGTGGGQGTAASPLGDLSTFRTIITDTQALLTAGDQSGATTRIYDLEFEWDKAQARLKAKDSTAWTAIDDKIDTVLRELRAASPNTDSEQAALSALLPLLN